MVENFKSFVGQAELTFDTGVSNVRIEEIDMRELTKMLPKPIFDDIVEKIKKNMSETGKQTFRMSGRSDTNFFNIEWIGSEEPKITQDSAYFYYA